MLKFFCKHKDIIYYWRVLTSSRIFYSISKNFICYLEPEINYSSRDFTLWLYYSVSYVVIDLGQFMVCWSTINVNYLIIYFSWSTYKKWFYNVIENLICFSFSSFQDPDKASIWLLYWNIYNASHSFFLGHPRLCQASDDIKITQKPSIAFLIQWSSTVSLI